MLVQAVMMTNTDVQQFSIFKGWFTFVEPVLGSLSRLQKKFIREESHPDHQNQSR
jgi:hypothetical protein